MNNSFDQATALDSTLTCLLRFSRVGFLSILGFLLDVAVLELGLRLPRCDGAEAGPVLGSGAWGCGMRGNVGVLPFFVLEENNF